MKEIRMKKRRAQESAGVGAAPKRRRFKNSNPDGLTRKYTWVGPQNKRGSAWNPDYGKLVAITFLEEQALTKR
jgi:hypothetical protein